jgi:phosphoribosylformylglycinamidine cyclo-ligase
MCVNDLICCGAEPLFFLDYFATGKLDTQAAATIIKSIALSLASIRCALLGGETAEMPGLYKPGEFDLAGFAVGLVDKKKIIEGKAVKKGDHVIGLHSSGVHSNGYSLVRKILTDNNIDLAAPHSFAPNGLGEALLAPTVLYVNPVLKLLKTFEIRAMAHITGGGIVENLPRVLPKTCQAVIEKAKIATPEVFHVLQKAGNVDESEMWRVFNMGIGYTLVVKEKDSAKILKTLKAARVPATLIGVIDKKKPGANGVRLV